jgi:hypothetical protein
LQTAWNGAADFCALTIPCAAGLNAFGRGGGFPQ